LLRLVDSVSARLPNNYQQKVQENVMEMIMDSPIQPATMHHLLAQAFSGSVLFHYAVVKAQQSQEQQTVAIEYRTEGNSLGELREIAEDLKARWELEDVLLVRRVGILKVGDIISLVAVSSPSSAAAFASCQYGISRIRKMETIKKNEMYG
jgi:molybdopterin synthase catalytic subunit